MGFHFSDLILRSENPNGHHEAAFRLFLSRGRGLIGGFRHHRARVTAVKPGRTPLKAAAIPLVEQNLLFPSSLADRNLTIQEGGVRDELPSGEKDFDVIYRAMGASPHEDAT